MTKEEFEARIIGMQDTLYRVSATLLRQPCDREDAIQECIFKALRKRETLRDDRYMQSWVIRILINECYSIHRRARWERPSENLPEPPPMPGPDADHEVFRALFSLEEKMRLPMVLHYVEGYSVEEVARILRVPSGTVKSRLARSREKMKKELEKEAGEQ